MATTAQFLADNRRRNLAVLGGIAVLSLLLAFVALRFEAFEVAPHYTPETFLPDIVPALRDGRAVDIHVVSNKGTFDVRPLAGKGWVIPQRNNFPASFDELRQTLVGLAALETIEPKTSRPDWYHYIDVDAPPKGNGVLVSINDAEGHSIAAVILGKSEDIGDPSGATGLFVRKPGDAQSWFVRAVFEPKGDIADWMNKSIVNIDRARIQEVDVAPANGPAFVVRRDKPSDADFALLNMPKGRELSDPGAADGMASALVGFTFDDAKPASGFDFSHATHVVTKTFEGMAVTANVIQQGPDYWATIGASGVPNNADATREMSDINAKASGWAFKLPTFKGQQFTASLASLLKPLTPPAKTTP